MSKEETKHEATNVEQPPKSKISCEYCNYTGFKTDLTCSYTMLYTTSNCKHCNPDYYHKNNSAERSW